MAEDLKAGDRVIHPNWCERREVGEVKEVINQWHADVLFDGWDRTVRASIDSLRLEASPDVEADTEDEVPPPAAPIADSELPF